jgi:DNA-binding PadR family transcriptional regulator
VHLRKLEEAGYVTVTKSFRARKPLTEVTLTEAGRKAFADYLHALGKLVGLGD